LTWQTGKLDRTQYSKRLSDALTDIMVDQIVEAIKGLGDLKDFQFKVGQSINGDRVYRYLVSCSSGSIAMIYAVGPDGKVDGLFFRPA
jgi:hypothetical protein